MIVGGITVQNHPLYRLHPNTHFVRQVKLQILLQVNIQLHILVLHHFLVRPLHPRRTARIESTKRSQSPIRHVLRRQRDPRQRHSLHRARRRPFLPPPSREVLPHRRYGQRGPVDFVGRIAVERLGLAHTIQQNALATPYAASSKRHSSSRLLQTRLQGLRRGEGEEGMRVERARIEMLVVVLRRHRQQPVRPRRLRRARAVHNQRGRLVGRLLARVLLQGREQLEVLQLVRREAGLRSGAERSELVGLVHHPDASEVVLAEGVADHGVERAVRVRRGRGGENGARAALVDEHVFQLRVSRRKNDPRCR